MAKIGGAVVGGRHFGYSEKNAGSRDGGGEGGGGVDKLKKKKKSVVM